MLFTCFPYWHASTEAPGLRCDVFEVPPVDGIEVFQLIRGGEYRTVVAVGSAIFGVENYFWVWLAHCRDHH
jgi:hypothetical protein